MIFRSGSALVIIWSVLEFWILKKEVNSLLETWWTCRSLKCCMVTSNLKYIVHFWTDNNIPTNNLNTNHKLFICQNFEKILFTGIKLSKYFPFCHSVIPKISILTLGFPPQKSWISVPGGQRRIVTDQTFVLLSFGSINCRIEVCSMDLKCEKDYTAILENSAVSTHFVIIHNLKYFQGCQ